jgi:tetratricopeptide (TPR) repeat protein/tRNA A-37 threonylcarbamoyl transferase component Bud32
MEASDFYEEDEDIRRFKKYYPSFYALVLMLIDGKCDDRMGVNKYFYNIIQKIVSGKLHDEDVRQFKEKNPIEFKDLCVPIQKLVERKAAFLAKTEPQIKPYKKGDFIGQTYEVYDVLGMGGFGIVYLVYSNETGSVRALKTFRDEYLKDAQTRDRFKKEAQVWIDLERHPYIVRAFYVDEISGRLYINMEHIASDEPGMNTLDGFLRRRPPDLAQSLRWAIQFCYGMEYAYAKGIKAHRDIKPSNILISQDETVKISDFGLAEVIGSTKVVSGIKLDIHQNKVGFSLQTKEGAGFGTPTHMPPEQFTNAAECDERSDIYSFGIVLYQMATGGKLPFLATLPKDNSDEESMRFWREMYVLHGQASIPKLNSPLFSIIQRCLEKEPRKRYQSFKEMRLDLETIFKQLTMEVVRVPEQKEMEAWEWMIKGMSLVTLGKSEEAIVCFDCALEIDSKDAKMWVVKGHALGKLDKPMEAIACYDRALQINPKLATAWSKKGVSLRHLDKHQAVACCSKAIEMEPMNVYAWCAKGDTLRSLGDHHEAISCYDRALEINPKDTDAWFGRGVALYDLGNPHEAIVCYNKMIEISPFNTSAWFGKGVALDTLGKDLEAIACYDKALETDPKNATIQSYKGVYLAKLDRHREAIVCFDRALEIDSKDAKIWMCKGDALFKLDKFTEAVACYDQVLKINPLDALAWNFKGVALYSLSKDREAINAFRNFIKFAPPNYTRLIAIAKGIIQDLEAQIR